MYGLFQSVNKSASITIVLVCLAFLSAITLGFWSTASATVCIGSGCQEGCPSIPLKPTVLLTEVTGSTASFCIYVGGSGWDDAGGGGFRMSLFQIVPGYASDYMGKCQRSLWGGLGVCDDCDSLFWLTRYIPSGRVVGFYVVGTQFVNEGYGVCVCTSDTTWVTIPESLQDTATIALPTQEELGKMTCDISVGDPINATNGNVYRQHSDVFVGGDCGLPINFSRYYNSFDTSASTIGNKWRHAFEYALWVHPDSGHVYIREGSGRLVPFQKVMNTSTGSYYYTAPQGIHYRLDHDGIEDTYTLTTEADVKHFFGADHKLSYIEDRNDNRLELFYTSGMLTSIVNASGRQLNLVYQNDKLWQVLSESANVLATYSYNATNGYLERVTYADNSWVNYTYKEVVVGGSETYTIKTFLSGTPQSEGLLEKIEDSDGGVRFFEFDEEGRALSAYGPDSVELVRLNYEAICGGFPRVCEVYVASRGGDKITTYKTMALADGKRRVLDEVVEPECSGCGVDFEYDAGGNKSAVTYESGVKDRFDYDSRGNMTMAARATNTSLADTTRVRYHSTFNLPTLEYSASVANPAGRDSTFYIRDLSGNLLKLIRAGWNSPSERYRDTVTYTYNAYGQVTKIDGPRADVGDTTVFAYYENGDLRYVVKANGDTTEFGQRDEMGNRTWVKDANGMIKRYEYDDRNRPSKVIMASGTADSTVTTFTRNFDGDITSINFPEGNAITYDYDNHDWLTSAVNSAGDSLLYQYDLNSNLTRMEIRDASGVLTKYEDYLYNDDDLLEIITNPDETYTEYTYDEMGNRLSVRDANGHYTYYIYDEISRLDSAIQVNGTDNLVTQFFYDRRNNLTSLIDADGYEFRFWYNDKGLLTKDSSAVTGVTTYSYDKAGNCVSKVNAAGDETIYHYDALNRLTLVEYADPAENVSYVYDDPTNNGLGRLCQEINGTSTLSYRYDIMGRMHQEVMTIGTLEYITTYDYDMNGEVAKLTHHVGQEIIYHRDAARRVDEVEWRMGDISQTLTSSIEYMPFGGPKSWVYGNGIEANVSYDDRYLIDSISTPNAAVVGRAYDHDPVGNITNIVNNLNSSRSKTFGYDDLDQLISSSSDSYPSGDIGFTYSGNGNRLTKTAGIDVTTYGYTDNRLTSLSGAETGTYDYDDLGNLTSSVIGGVPRSYEYDHTGRLISIDQGSSARYYYDTRSRRVKSTVGGSGKLFLYGSAGQLINEMTSLGSWKCGYVYLNGRLLAKIYNVVTISGGYPGDRPASPKLDSEPGGPQSGQDKAELDNIAPPQTTITYKFLYYHLDHLGTPLAMTDEDQEIVWSTEYYPFGGLYDEMVVQSNEFRFPGQYHDRETDLYYNWHRYYDSRTGRYVSADPLGLGAGDVNLYRYVGNGPMNYVDPSGQMADGDATIFGEKEQACENPAYADCEITIVEAPCDRSWGWCYTRCIETLAPGFDEFFIGSQILSNAPYTVAPVILSPDEVIFVERPTIFKHLLPRTWGVASKVSKVVRPIQAVTFAWVAGVSYGCMLSCALDPCSY